MCFVISICVENDYVMWVRCWEDFGEVKRWNLGDLGNQKWGLLKKMSNLVLWFFAVRTALEGVRTACVFLACFVFFMPFLFIYCMSNIHGCMKYIWGHLWDTHEVL